MCVCACVRACVCVCVCVCVGVQSCSKTVKNRTCNVALYNSHSISRERSCLVRADGCCVAHCFTSIQMPHKIIIMHHFLPQTTKNQPVCKIIRNF